MKRDNILIYRSQFEALKDVDGETFKEVFLAIADYGMDGIEPACTGTALALFKLMKPIIDKNNRKYMNASQGGRPKKEEDENQTETKPKPNENQTETKPEPNHILKDKCKRINDKGEMLKDKERDILSDKSDPAYPYADVVEYLNQKSGANFRIKSKDTRKLIKARCDEGFTLEDFKTVIDKKVAEWKDDEKMAAFLRPSTLFGTKFESYLNQQTVKGKSKNRFNNFPQRDYDFADFEKQLLNASLGGGQ